MPKNTYSKRVAFERKSAANAAVDVIANVTGVFLQCVTFVLNDMNYGENGIKNFVDKINRYIDEFSELSNIEHIDKGYTKGNSVKYALSVYERRRKDITGDEPPVVELYKILDCVRRGM